MLAALEETSESWPEFNSLASDCSQLHTKSSTLSLWVPPLLSALPPPCHIYLVLCVYHHQQHKKWFRFTNNAGSAGRDGTGHVSDSITTSLLFLCHHPSFLPEALEGLPLIGHVLINSTHTQESLLLSHVLTREILPIGIVPSLKWILVKICFSLSCWIPYIFIFGVYWNAIYILDFLPFTFATVAVSNSTLLLLVN